MSRQYIRANRAFSPFTGVLLLLLTVFLLAGTVAIFFGGLSPGADQSEPPSVNFEYDYVENPDGNEAITISHREGGQINPDQLNVVIDGAYCLGDDNPNGKYNAVSDFGFASDNWISAGNSIVIDKDNPEQLCKDGKLKFEGAVIKLVWVNPSGSDVTLDEWRNNS